MSYKLVAFDMDGTLLNSQKEISEGNRRAIARAVAGGKVVVLSTGRCLPELDEFLPQLEGVRYLSCVSGGYIYDVETKSFVYKNMIPKECVEQILEASRQEDCMVHFLDEQSIVKGEDISRMEHFHMEVYRPMYERVTTKVEDMYVYYEKGQPDVTKLNLYHATEEGRLRTKKCLEHVAVEKVYSETTALECSNLGVTKGVGLKKLCEHLGIEMKDTIGVGDADNDLEMLKVVGLSVAMGNANENVKSICDVVVSDNDHDGCAEVIDRWLLQENERKEEIV